MPINSALKKRNKATSTTFDICRSVLFVQSAIQRGRKGATGRKTSDTKARVATLHEAQVCLTVSGYQLQRNGKRFGRKYAIM